MKHSSDCSNHSCPPYCPAYQASVTEAVEKLRSGASIEEVLGYPEGTVLLTQEEHDRAKYDELQAMKADELASFAEREVL